MAELIEWLVLIYKIPAEPSRYRVAVWRRLKAAGAVYLQNSACTLPDNPANRELFQTLSREIDAAGGESLLLTASPLDQAGQNLIIERFNEDRNGEYAEFLEQGQAFLAEIEKETGRHNFTYAELEENDEALNRLKTWLKKIKERDYFSASGAVAAEQCLALCQEALEDFAALVFTASQT